MSNDCNCNCHMDREFELACVEYAEGQIREREERARQDAEIDASLRRFLFKLAVLAVVVYFLAQKVPLIGNLLGIQPSG